MQDLKPLIRLNQREVDQRRRVLVQLQEALAKLLEEREAFERQVVAERELAFTDLMLARSYPAFARLAEMKREEYERRAATLRLEAERAEEAVAEAFRELKKFEQVQEQRDQAAKAARKYRETQMFDEVASIRFSRQQGAAEEEGEG
ncbi:hypothetical protein [Niveispirillum sp. KHB5.9]|uniref:hypothetical protein n=1 Tax=Niveispirillum sp. KHB5.9 TaxID=3400269 RepID=UPI003A8C3F4B